MDGWSTATGNKARRKANIADITQKVAAKYIKFGEEKKSIPDHWQSQWKTKIYTRANANRSNWKIQLQAAYQAMLVIAGDRHFENIHMETFCKLASACKITTVTYACETRKLAKEENEKKLNQLLDRTIRILMVPESTPREALEIKSGLLDIEAITDKNRMMMGERINKDGTQLPNEVTKIQYLEDGMNSSERQKKNMTSLTKTSKKTKAPLEKYQQRDHSCLQKYHGTKWREQAQNKLPPRRH